MKKKDKYPNVGKADRKLLEKSDILKDKKKTLKEDIEIFKEAGNYDERRVKDYRIAVKTAIGALQRFGDVYKDNANTPLGTNFFFASGDRSYFPLPREAKTESTKEQKEQKEKDEEAKDKKEEEFMKRTEDANLLWNKYKNGNWDKTEKKFLEEDLKSGENPGVSRAEIIETGKTKIKKFIIYYLQRWNHTRYKKTKAYRLPKEFQ